MNARLTINLRDGLLEVEGAEDFVRTIYHDFKEQVARTALQPGPTNAVEQLEHHSPPAEQPNERRQKRSRRRPSAEGGKTKPSDSKPTFKDLNLAGLGEFYDKFGPKNHNEKILCFVIFLRDQLKIRPCSADDVYTCYCKCSQTAPAPGQLRVSCATEIPRTARCTASRGSRSR